MNVDDPKSASGIIAVALRRPSTRTNAASAIRPAVNDKEAGADQPRDEFSVKAHVAEPRPIAPAAAPTAAQTPMARPFASPEKAIPNIARLFGITKAALAP